MLVGDEVALRLPGDPDYGRMARTASITLARRLGFTFREVEDLGLAVDEAVVLLWQPTDTDGPLPSLELVLTTTDDGLTAVLRLLPAAGDGAEPPALSTAARTRFEALSADLHPWTCTVGPGHVDIVGRRGG